MTENNIDKAYSLFQAERFPPTNEKVVALVEKQTRAKFPDHYRNYLLEYNGCYFEPPGPMIDAGSDEYPPPFLQWMYGIGADHPSGELGDQSKLNLWEGNDPPILYPIGRTEAGFFILLITEPGDDYGCIYLRTYQSPVFNTENESHYLAQGMEEFFGLLVEPELPDDLKAD